MEVAVLRINLARIFLAKYSFLRSGAAMRQIDVRHFGQPLGALAWDR